MVSGVQLCFFAFWILVSLLAIKNLIILYYNRSTDFTSKFNEEKWAKNLHHLLVISCYKEPLELIKATLETLANQTMSYDVTLAVSFEERTPDLKKKQGSLCETFGSSFRELMFSNHPYGLEGEIPGKCSNANCGIRTAIEHIKKRDGKDFNIDNLVITTCDADSKFHPKFIEALTAKYVQEDQRKNCIFQVRSNRCTILVCK